MLRPDFRHERDGVTIDPRQIILAIAELLAPISACPPCRAFQHKPQAPVFGQLRIGRIIVAQRAASFFTLQEIERGEIGQLDAVQEYERGLDTAIGQKNAPRELRQFGPVLGHLSSSRIYLRSGGTDSSLRSLSASARLMDCCWLLPKRRTFTLCSSISRLPTTSITGTFASECSRTL